MRFETMADDVAARIGHLGHERADVMGFSLGGGVALETALEPLKAACAEIGNRMSCTFVTPN